MWNNTKCLLLKKCLTSRHGWDVTRLNNHGKKVVVSWVKHRDTL